jgi:ABC-type lipoprotein export system ATPase subunit
LAEPLSPTQLKANGDGQKVEKLMALKNVNCSIKKGEFVCIIGDVGSGKSSLLQALIGDMLPLNENDFTLLKNENANDLDVKQ